MERLRALYDATPAEWLIFGGAVLLLVLLIALAFRFRAWFREDEGPAVDDQLMLRQIRDLHQKGDLSAEEYRSIKGQLVQRLDDPAPSPERETDEGA